MLIDEVLRYQLTHKKCLCSAAAGVDYVYAYYGEYNAVGIFSSEIKFYAKGTMHVPILLL